MISCYKVFIDKNYTKTLLEVLRCEVSAVVRSEFLYRTVVEHPRIHEMFRDFGGRYTFHRYRLSRFGKPAGNDKYMFILW